ncbi:MAG: choice-of-anchor P family protein [Burkholderiaceae bacterium]
MAATGAQGRGYGLNVTANVAVVGLSAPLGDTDTQTTPPNFNESVSVISANVTAAPVLTLTTDAVTGSTVSNLAMNQVDASGGVDNLNLNAVGVGGIGLVTLTADVIQSEAKVRCSAGSAQASGTTQIANLQLKALGLSALTVNGTPDVNQSLVNLDLKVPIVGTTLAQLQVTLNQQSSAGGVFSVNALRLHLNVLGLAVIDTVIGHSEVKLDDCAAPANMGAVTISVPNPINAGNQASVPVTGSCTPGSASSVALSATSTPAWSASAVCQPGGTYGTTVDASGWADGSITFTAQQDSASAQTTVTKDSTGGGGGTPPTVTITTAADPINAGNQASYTIGGACSDNTVPVNLLISSGGTNYNPGNATCSGGAWTTTISTTTLPDGAVTIRASQTNADGTGTANKIVTKFTAVPVVSVYPPLAVNQANVGGFSVSGSCSENGQAVTVALSDGANTVPASPTCSGGQWTASGLNLSALNDGTISVTASQTNGNGTGTDSKNTQKDVTPPTVTVTAPPIDTGNQHDYSPTGTCTAGDGDVTVTIGSLPPVTASCEAGGTWTAPPTDVSSLPRGDVVVTASQTDAAGNTGTGSATAAKSTEGTGGGSGSIAPVPVGGLWAGLLLLATGLGVLRRRTSRQT